MKELQPSDLPALIAIYKANQKLPGAPSWTDQQLTEEAWESQSLVARLNSGGMHAFILYRKTPDAYEISYLATDPRAKRQGLMQGLLMRLIKLAAAEQLKVWLEVHESNVGARSLYEKMGLKMVSQRRNYYSDGGSAILYNYG